VVDSGYGGWWSAVNLVLKKRERVTTGGKGRDEISGEVGKVTGMVTDASTKANLGKGIECLVDGGWQSEM
jgi:hypothetical protein